MTAALSRSVRLSLSATSKQAAVLRRAAEAADKPLADFILDSACPAAEKVLLDQRSFQVSEGRLVALLELLDRPAQDNVGLQDLQSRRAREKALPFDVLVPNEVTIAAMKKARQGGLESFDSTEGLMANLKTKDRAHGLIARRLQAGGQRLFR